MKLLKRIFFAFIILFALVQIPFVYRRYEIGKLAEKIQSLNSERRENADPRYKDYVGVIHAHTSLGGHSNGRIEDIIPSAARAKLDFVVMTEHTSEYFDTSAALQGVHEGVLFVNGQEVATLSNARFLLVPGNSESHEGNKMSPHDFLARFRADGRLAFVAYPDTFENWDENIDGIEVFNIHTNATQMNKVPFVLDLLWSYYAYPELLLTRYFQRPDDNLKKFDELSQTRKLTLFAGTDAHSNIGYHLFGDDSGNKIINLKFDNYESMFHLARNHILLEKDKPLTQENLLAALKNGNCFFAFEALGDARGFSFEASANGETKILGEAISLKDVVRLKVTSPLKSRTVLFKNGQKIFETAESNELVFDAKEKGAYRAEIYLDSLGAPFDKTPWITSNPIYVR